MHIDNINKFTLLAKDIIRNHFDELARFIQEYHLSICSPKAIITSAVERFLKEWIILR